METNYTIYLCGYLLGRRYWFKDLDNIIVENNILDDPKIRLTPIVLKTISDNTKNQSVKNISIKLLNNFSHVFVNKHFVDDFEDKSLKILSQIKEKKLEYPLSILAVNVILLSTKNGKWNNDAYEKILLNNPTEIEKLNIYDLKLLRANAKNIELLKILNAEIKRIENSFYGLK